MLNIFRSKKFAKRTLLIILILIIPPFVLWGVGNITKRPSIIGKIDGHNVYPEEFVKSVQGIKVELLLNYFSNFEQFQRMLRNRPEINRMAWDRLVFLSAARKSKIKVGNRDVLFFLARHPMFIRNGVFDKQLYTYIVSNTLGLEPRQFEELVRENLMVNSFQNNLLSDKSISEEELMYHFKRLNSKIDISYILLEKDSFAENIEVTPDEIKDFYNKNSDKFFTPQGSELEYIEYSSGNSEEREKIIAELDRIYPELKASPGKFNEIAEEHKAKYTRTGSVSKETLIPGIKYSKELYDTILNLGENQVSPPIFASTGSEDIIYVFHNIKTTPPHQQTLEEAREEVSRILKDIKSMEMVKNRSAELFQKINSGEASLEDAAQEAGQALRTGKEVQINDYIESVGPASAIVNLAIEAKPKDILGPIQVSRGFMVARVDNITEAPKEKFEEQKNILFSNLLISKKRDAVQQWMATSSPKVSLSRNLDEL